MDIMLLITMIGKMIELPIAGWGSQMGLLGILIMILGRILMQCIPKLL
jgi:hypothetical protein